MLPNGAVVYLMPKPGVPLVSFRILVKGGVESEPAGLAGICRDHRAVAAHAARRAARPTSFRPNSTAWAERFGAGANEQARMVSSEFLKKDFEAGLDLTADAVLHPSFPEAEVKKVLARNIDGDAGLERQSAGGDRPVFPGLLLRPGASLRASGRMKPPTAG